MRNGVIYDLKIDLGLELTISMSFGDFIYFQGLYRKSASYQDIRVPDVSQTNSNTKHRKQDSRKPEDHTSKMACGGHKVGTAVP